MANVTTLTSLFAFAGIARAYFRSRDLLRVHLHPETVALLSSLNVVTFDTDHELSIEGIKVVEATRIPAGYLRLRLADSDLDLPVDPEATSTEAFRGGTCEVETKCRACTWRHFPEDGMTPVDALAHATYLAQQHRRETGHDIAIAASVHLVSGGSADG